MHKRDWNQILQHFLLSGLSVLIMAVIAIAILGLVYFITGGGRT